MMNGKGDPPSAVTTGATKSTKPVLPQIQRHPAYYEDPYKNSMLFSFKLKDKQQAMLEGIVYVASAVGASDFSAFTAAA